MNTKVKIIITAIVIGILLLVALILKWNDLQVLLRKQIWSNDAKLVSEYTQKLGTFSFPQTYSSYAGYTYQGIISVIHRDDSNKGDYIFIESINLSGLDKEYYRDIRHGWANSFYIYYYRNITNQTEKTETINNTLVDFTRRSVTDNAGNQARQTIVIVDTSKSKILVAYTCSSASCTDEKVLSFIKSIK